MNTFTKAIFTLLEEGQNLSVSDRLLVLQIIKDFTEDYRNCLNEDPKALFGTIYLIAPLLEAYGFRLPRIERWTKEDMADFNYILTHKRR